MLPRLCGAQPHRGTSLWRSFLPSPFPRGHPQKLVPAILRKRWALHLPHRPRRPRGRVYGKLRIRVPCPRRAYSPFLTFGQPAVSIPSTDSAMPAPPSRPRWPAGQGIPAAWMLVRCSCGRAGLGRVAHRGACCVRRELYSIKLRQVGRETWPCERQTGTHHYICLIRDRGGRAHDRRLQRDMALTKRCD